MFSTSFIYYVVASLNLGDASFSWDSFYQLCLGFSMFSGFVCVAAKLSETSY